MTCRSFGGPTISRAHLVISHLCKSCGIYTSLSLHAERPEQTSPRAFSVRTDLVVFRFDLILPLFDELPLVACFVLLLSRDDRESLADRVTFFSALICSWRYSVVFFFSLFSSLGFF